MSVLETEQLGRDWSERTMLLNSILLMLCSNMDLVLLSNLGNVFVFLKKRSMWFYC